MPNLPILPTIRVWNDLPSLNRRGDSSLSSTSGAGSGPSLRLTSQSIDPASTLINAGYSIGLLLSLTYAALTTPLSTGEFPRVRINSY